MVGLVSAEQIEIHGHRVNLLTKWSDGVKSATPLPVVRNTYDSRKYGSANTSNIRRIPNSASLGATMGRHRSEHGPEFF